MDNLDNGYHGLVKENETLVEVTPAIRATGEPVCSFRIVNKYHGEAPFEIISKEEGYAELRARKLLNCEKRRNYKFDIAAVGCNGKQSVRYVYRGSPRTMGRTKKKILFMHFCLINVE